MATLPAFTEVGHHGCPQLTGTLFICNSLILQSLKAVQKHLEVLHRGSGEGASQTAGELGNEQIVGSMSLLQMRAEK